MSLTITGREIDGHGNPLIGANVTIYQSDTDTQVSTTTTNSNGIWSFTVDTYAAGYDVKVVWGRTVRWYYIDQQVQAQAVAIDGSTTLDDWRHADDLAKLDGGDVEVGSLTNLVTVHITGTVRIDNQASTGANTPTLGTNKPGSAATLTPQKWLALNLDGTVYYFPGWV